MRVLYVNQTAQMSGAEHSLLTLIAGLGDRVTPMLACPDGDLADAARDRSIPVETIRGTDVSLALHPVRTPKALTDIALDGARIAQIARREQIDVIHANTTRAGLIATTLAGLRTPPVVMHVRDWTPDGAITKAILQYARARASALICISQLVADEFSRGFGGALHVIYNPIDGARFDPDRIDRDAARDALGLSPDAAAIGVVAQLTRWKGQVEAVRALAEVAERFPHAHLFVVGSAKFQSARLDNGAYEETLRALPATLGIEDRVTFLGERSDIPEILRALDVLLVPSWKEAFGRIVVEGMSMGLPVIATNVGGPREVVTSGVDGILAAPRDTAAWAQALTRLLDDPGLRAQLGTAARTTARTYYTPAHAADAVAAIYAELVGT